MIHFLLGICFPTINLDGGYTLTNIQTFLTTKFTFILFIWVQMIIENIKRFDLNLRDEEKKTI